MMHFRSEMGQSSKASSVYARLDKTGYRVICGKIECGQDIAAVVLAWPRHEDYYRVLCFPSGWYQGRDSVWRLSLRARQRLNKDNRARSMGIIPGGEALILRKVPLARRALGQSWENSMPIHALKRPKVPGLAQCAFCGAIQNLDAPRLRSIDPRSPLLPCEVGGPVQWEDWDLEQIPEDSHWTPAQDRRRMARTPREFRES